MKTILMLFVTLISYLGGFYSYEGTLWIGWKQTLGGDRHAMLSWSLMAYIIILVPLYLWICFAIKSKIKSSSIRMACYPICCAALFALPTMFIIGSAGGGSLFSPEAQLFNSFFVSSGILYGVGYGLISHKYDKKR